MAENSKIEWTDHTVNLWWGCAKVHTGCKNCYAENLSNRFGDNVWGEKAQRKLIKSATKDLNKYQNQAKKENKISKVFIGSMMDIFEEPKSIIGLREPYVNTGTLRDNLFAEITEGKYKNLVFLFLTKRPQNIMDFIPVEWIKNTPKNVWFGTSVSNEETEKYAVDLVVNSPENANLFLSIEPQVGSVSIKSIDYKLRNTTGDDYCLQPTIKWVIQGGESGNKKRPFNLTWARELRDECSKIDYENIAYFFKQIDKIQEIPSDLMIREFPRELQLCH